MVNIKHQNDTKTGFVCYLMVSGKKGQKWPFPTSVQYSRVLSLVYFLLLIWIVLTCMFLIYRMNRKWTLIFFTDSDSPAVITYSIIPLHLLQYMDFSRKYSTLVLNSMVTLLIPFAMCLLLVWKAFVRIEMEPKNTK